MRGVIEEKTNRIVEVIVSSVKPFELMMGKIAGIAAIALIQFTAWIILTVSFITIGQKAMFPDISISETNKIVCSRHHAKAAACSDSNKYATAYHLHDKTTPR